MNPNFSKIILTLGVVILVLFILKKVREAISSGVSETYSAVLKPFTNAGESVGDTIGQTYNAVTWTIEDVLRAAGKAESEGYVGPS